VTGLRIASAAVLIPLVLLLVFLAPTWLFALAVALVLMLALREYFELARLSGMSTLDVPGYFFALALVAAQAVGPFGTALFVSAGELTRESHVRLESAFSPALVLLAFLVVAAAWSFTLRVPLGQFLSGLATTGLGLLWIALPLSLLVSLRGISTYFGPRLVFLLFAMIWVGDAAAYFAGRAIGRHKLSPRISPGKTVEGAIANLLGALLVAVIFAPWNSAIPLAVLLLGAFLTNVASQLSDLAESALKRGAGAKDSGRLIPGHGGVLDRIDSLLLATPVLWYYCLLVVRQHI
jgi:phosphatidate cytidylyltransferase